MKHLYIYVLTGISLALGNIAGADAQSPVPQKMTQEYCQAVFDRCKNDMSKGDKASVDLGFLGLSTPEGFAELYDTYLAKYDKKQQAN